MKEVTVITNVYSQASVSEVPIAESTLFHKEWMDRLGGQFLDMGEGYLITRNKASSIVAVFNAQQEETAFKITFTGLQPFQKFSLLKETEELVDVKCANQAGIIEFRITIPEGMSMLMRQTVPGSDCKQEQQ